MRKPLPYRGGPRAVSCQGWVVDITLIAIPRDSFTTCSVFLLGGKAHRAGNQGPAVGPCFVLTSGHISDWEEKV